LEFVRWQHASLGEDSVYTEELGRGKRDLSRLLKNSMDSEKEEARSSDSTWAFSRKGSKLKVGGLN